MTRYFMRDTPLCQLEQQMMTPPNFKVRGHGRYSPGFQYSSEDTECPYCINFRRNQPCPLKLCICLDERIAAGALNLNEFVRDCFFPEAGVQLLARLERNFTCCSISFFLNECHRERWQHWRERYYRMSGRNLATLFLLTAYEDIVDGNYLYNRCHLIGFQLSGENANERNLITGTRYLNIDGMLPFENMVADYVQETNSHVLYRVTPVFEGDNLLAAGVLMEGYSVEDDGDGICFCIFAYNVQPGVKINYATGDSTLNGATSTSDSDPSVVQVPSSDPQAGTSTVEAHYVLNNNTKKFHLPSCSSADDIKASNKEEYHGSRDELISMGYDPCKRCNP